MVSRRLLSCLAIGFACLAISGIAQAQSIGVSFSTDRDNVQLSPDEVAGVPEVAQSNWNVNDGGADAQAAASGSTADIVGPVAGQLSDSNGDASGASVTWVSNGTWNTTNGADTPDAKLMNGYIDAIGADAPVARVTIENIPYASYLVYAYIGSDGNGRTGQVTDGTTTYSYSTFSNDPDGSGGFTPDDYAQTTDTGDGFPNANYAVFSGSSSSVTLDIIRGSNNSGFHAVQIVNAGGGAAQVPLSPLPVAAALAIAGFVALRRRRRAEAT